MIMNMMLYDDYYDDWYFAEEDYFEDDCKDLKKYVGQYANIVSTKKGTYVADGVVGLTGKVESVCASSLGLIVDGKYNKSSDKGVYWFKKNELNFLCNVNDEREVIKMKKFEYVAIVNLVDDYNKKDYAFALYSEDYEVMSVRNIGNENRYMVVVNPRGNNKRILGTVKEIMTIDEFSQRDNKNIKITAEVVGVVNMDGYIAREEEKVRVTELAKKKAAIEKELEKEINKRESVEYYEEMASRYSDNPKLAELVAELKSLGA